MLVGHRTHLCAATLLALVMSSVQAQDETNLEVLTPDADAVARLEDEFNNGKFSIRPLRGLKAAGSPRPDLEDRAIFMHGWTPDGKLDGVANLFVGLTPFAQPSSENLDKTLKGMGIDTEHLRAARFHGVEVRFGHYKQKINGQEIIGHLLLGIDTRGTFAIKALLHPEEATPERTAEAKASLLTFKRAEKSLLNTESGADWAGVPTRILEHSALSKGVPRFTDPLYKLSWQTQSDPKEIRRGENSVTYRFHREQVAIELTILKSKPMIESARSVFLDALESSRATRWKQRNLPVSVKPVARLRYQGMIGRMMMVTVAQGDEALMFADLRAESFALMFEARGRKGELEPAINTVLQSVTSGKSLRNGDPASARSEPSIQWHVVSDAPLPASKPTGDAFPVPFANLRDVPVELLWIDRTGKQRSYGTIEPADRKEIKTKQGAIWLIADESGKPIGYFSIGSQSALAEIPAGAE